MRAWREEKNFRPFGMGQFFPSPIFIPLANLEEDAKRWTQKWPPFPDASRPHHPSTRNANIPVLIHICMMGWFEGWTMQIRFLVTRPPDDLGFIWDCWKRTWMGRCQIAKTVSSKIHSHLPSSPAYCPYSFGLSLRSCDCFQTAVSCFAWLEIDDLKPLVWLSANALRDSPSKVSCVLVFRSFSFSRPRFLAFCRKTVNKLPFSPNKTLFYHGGITFPLSSPLFIPLQMQIKFIFRGKKTALGTRKTFSFR